MHHGYSPIGRKDQLVMKVFLLCSSQTSAITAREEEQLKDLIELTYKVILEQRHLNISFHVYRKRMFTLQTKSPHFIKAPAHIQSENDLQHLFDPLLNSPKRQVALEMVINDLSGIDHPKCTKLKEMCRTRWVERQDAFEVFVQLYNLVVKCLEDISGENSASWNCDTVADVQSLYTWL